jgi:hypothetical protein
LGNAAAAAICAKVTAGPMNIHQKTQLARLTVIAALVFMALQPAQAQGIAISGPPCGVPESYETDWKIIAAYNRCRARYYAEMNCNVGDRVACLRLKLLEKEMPK